MLIENNHEILYDDQKDPIKSFSCIKCQISIFQFYDCFLIFNKDFKLINLKDDILNCSMYCIKNIIE